MFTRKKNYLGAPNRSKEVVMKIQKKCSFLIYISRLGSEMMRSESKWQISTLFSFPNLFSLVHCGPLNVQWLVKSHVHTLNIPVASNILQTNRQKYIFYSLFHIVYQITKTACITPTHTLKLNVYVLWYELCSRAAALLPHNRFINQSNWFKAPKLWANISNDFGVPQQQAS